MSDHDPQIPLSPRRKVSQRSQTLNLTTSPRYDALISPKDKTSSRHSEKRSNGKDHSEKLSDPESKSKKKDKDEGDKKQSKSKSRSLGRSSSNQIIKDLEKLEVFTSTILVYFFTDFHLEKCTTRSK